MRAEGARTHGILIGRELSIVAGITELEGGTYSNLWGVDPASVVGSGHFSLPAALAAMTVPNIERSFLGGNVESEERQCRLL
jgi:hypothetical protein